MNRVFSFSLSFFVVCFSAFPPGIVYGLENMNIGYTAITAAIGPLWIAKERKLFEKYGLDAQVIYTGGSPQGIAALLAGHLDVLSTGGAGFTSARLRGADIRAIAVPIKRLTFTFMTRDDVREAARDLKGKRIGIGGFGGMTYFATMYVLREVILNLVEI